MYQPEHKSKVYFFILAAFASFIGWAFLTFYRPLVIKAGCSEIAAKTSSVIGSKNGELENYFSFDNEKNRCLEELMLIE
ncbi:hypothetical protein A2865_00470 [Candidatus Woesebacteria bacterium RIFCSPHIGHO2_01_FULL_39_17]|nr:MAG: hypothetical protein A2865_00470 [Candidatus Woesebacteria bacterium RIFCSPHIGHO2_01_FULL_39_17]OGM65257.1 MAG: hypothetical protein A3A52_01905 [Candidatus Woesebacteria bacterium RIFCSPLOWO2_01_FULL_39_14]